MRTQVPYRLAETTCTCSYLASNITLSQTYEFSCSFTSRALLPIRGDELLLVLALSVPCKRNPQASELRLEVRGGQTSFVNHATTLAIPVPSRIRRTQRRAETNLNAAYRPNGSCLLQLPSGIFRPRFSQKGAVMIQHAYRRALVATEVVTRRSRLQTADSVTTSGIPQKFSIRNGLYVPLCA